MRDEWMLEDANKIESANKAHRALRHCVNQHLVATSGVASTGSWNDHKISETRPEKMTNLGWISKNDCRKHNTFRDPPLVASMPRLGPLRSMTVLCSSVRDRWLFHSCHLLPQRDELPMLHCFIAHSKWRASHIVMFCIALSLCGVQLSV